MPALSTIVLFFAAALALLLVPGPAVLYIVTRSIDQGRRAGLASALGVGVANFCHTAAATLGLSALLMSSATLFALVKYAGAAYLIYLGVRTLLTRKELRSESAPEPKKLFRVFFQGIVVNLLNPKTALFFLAFLPQFVDPARGSPTGQILFFGCMFAVMGVCSDSTYALLAGTFSAWLKRSTLFLKAQRYVAGTVYIGLGLTTALAVSEKKG